MRPEDLGKRRQVAELEPGELEDGEIGSSPVRDAGASQTFLCMPFGHAGKIDRAPARVVAGQEGQLHPCGKLQLGRISNWSGPPGPGPGAGGGYHRGGRPVEMPPVRPNRGFSDQPGERGPEHRSRMLLRPLHRTPHPPLSHCHAVHAARPRLALGVPATARLPMNMPREPIRPAAGRPGGWDERPSNTDLRLVGDDRPLDARRERSRFSDGAPAGVPMPREPSCRPPDRKSVV